MNWRLIVVLSLLSIFLAAGTIVGLVKGDEWIGWLIIGVISGWQLAGKVQDNFFLYGMYLGILDGILNSTIKAIFFESYVSVHPRMMDVFTALPQDLSPRMVMLIMGPLVGAVLGVFFGLLTVLASIVRQRKRTTRD